MAFVIDMGFKELPARLHPVDWIGKTVWWLEYIGTALRGRMPAFVWGVFLAVLVPAVSGCLAWVAANGLRELGGVPYILGVAVSLSTTFAVKGLASAATRVRVARNF